MADMSDYTERTHGKMGDVCHKFRTGGFVHNTNVGGYSTMTTTLAVTAFEIAKETGIEVDQKRIDLAFAYVRKSTTKDSYMARNSGETSLCAIALAMPNLRRWETRRGVDRVAFRPIWRQVRDMRFLALLLSLVSVCTARAFELPPGSTQCVLGVADGWNSTHVTLSYFEKRDGKWQRIGGEWKGRLGTKGLIWGRGLQPNPGGATLKKEGDGRSPAGVFDIGGVWGAHKSVKKHPKTFYHQVTPRDLWVEDAGSKYYNQFLTLGHQPKTRWEKKAQMKQDDYPHSLKMFISHNAFPNIVSGGGSSIFFHIWRREGAAATAGCTTMVEEKLRWIIATVDPGRQPLYVLLPRSEYDKLKPIWKLP